jgi:hypothetical protein
MKPKLESITIRCHFDESPDTSHLGKFSATPSGGYYVDRKEGVLYRDGVAVAEPWTDYGRNQHQFITGFQHSPGAKGWEHVDNAGVAHGYLRCRYRGNGRRGIKNLFAHHGVKGWERAVTREQKIECLNAVYCCEDTYRLETLARGDWHYMGVKAEAVYSRGSLTQVVSSGGLWGVESDSSPEYIQEITAEEMAELTKELLALGISQRAIAKAAANAERVEA